MNPRAVGQPAELYLFRYGTDPASYYAYTDITEPITVGAYVYQPLPIKRGKIVSSGTLDKSALSVEAPLSCGAVELFRIYPPDEIVTLVIRSGSITDGVTGTEGDWPVVWSGRIIQCSRDNENGPIGTFTCEPASTSMRRTGLRRHYQLSCPHVLYAQGDSLCNADKVARTINTTVESLTTTNVTVPAADLAGYVLTKFLGGTIEWTSPAGRAVRSIIRISGSAFILSGPTTGLAVADAVAVSLGCNHQTDDCDLLHQNILNYGGQPYIPQINPIKTNPFN
jgi:hypothetical protein